VIIQKTGLSLIVSGQHRPEVKITVRNPDSIRPYQDVLECLSGYLLLVEKQYLDKSFEGPITLVPTMPVVFLLAN
jgi:hypothetical protein